MEYFFEEITEKMLRAAMNVHGALGSGFPELIYQRTLQIEFDVLKLNYTREAMMPVYCRDVRVGERRFDFLIEDKICVELKAISHLENAQLEQAKNYLEAFNLQIGLLIKFGTTSLEWKRICNNKFKPNQ